MPDIPEDSRLSLIEKMPKGMGLFQCSCGTRKIIYRSSVEYGRSKSCGCLQKEVGRANGLLRTKHGMRGSRTYNSWRSMRARCENQNDPSFGQYGGAGITVCERWTNGEDHLSGFECFYADMGERPSHTTLDRLDGKLGYFPGNCRWATHVEQQNNRKNNIHFEINGEVISGLEIENRFGISRDTVGNRYRSGLRGLDLVGPLRGKHRGEGHSGHKLSEKDVILILNDTRPSLDISKQYGVTPGAINSIRKGRSWRHVTGK